MDAIGNIQLSVLPQSAPSSAGSVPVSGSAAPAVLPQHGTGGADFNAKAAEEKRQEAIRQAAQDIANVYVVSDRQFTIFKDVTGQYITRFRDLRDGRVTYVPEPELFKQQNASIPSFVTLKV